MKIFCIGMFKTGTTSLGSAFDILGYKTLHGPWWSGGMLKDPFYQSPEMWPEYYPLIIKKANEYTAFEDYPWMFLYKECDKWFKDAKFILTERNPDNVVKSSINQFRTALVPPDETPSPQEFRDRYENHRENVMDYFRNKDNLLIMNLEKRDGWNLLCPFLGVDQIVSEFPHLNKGFYK